MQVTLKSTISRRDEEAESARNIRLQQQRQDLEEQINQALEMMLIGVYRKINWYPSCRKMTRDWQKSQMNWNIMVLKLCLTREI